MRWIPLISLIVYSIVLLLLLPRFISRKEKTASKSAIISFVFIWLIFVISVILRFDIPDEAYIFVIISLIMDSYFGYYKGLYYKSRKYDRLQHLIGSFSFAIFLYFLFSNFFTYGGSKAFQAFYVIILGISYGALYETLEFISDLKNKEKMQKGLRDTNFDMVFDIIGSLCAAAIIFFVYL